MYGKYALKMANIEIVHDGCWTMDVDYGISIESLGRIIYPEKGIVRAFLVVDSNKKKQLIKKLKDKGKIKDILNISQYNSKLVLDVIEYYNNSVLKLLNDNGVQVIKVIKRNGKEFWRFIGYEFQISRALKDISEVAKIEYSAVKEFNLAIAEPNLTISEIRSLIAAIQMGYFDYPKRATAEEVARALGIRKSTFIYHIRNAQKKLVESLISTSDIRESER